MNTPFPKFDPNSDEEVSDEVLEQFLTAMSERMGYEVHEEHSDIGTNKAFHKDVVNAVYGTDL